MLPFPDALALQPRDYRLPRDLELARELGGGTMYRRVEAWAQQVLVLRCLDWILTMLSDPRRLRSLDRRYVFRGPIGGPVPADTLDTWDGASVNFNRDAVEIYFSAAGPNRTRRYVFPNLTRIRVFYDALALGLRVGLLRTFERDGELWVEAMPSALHSLLQHELRDEIRLRGDMKRIVTACWPACDARQLAVRLGAWTKGDVALVDADCRAITPEVYSPEFREAIFELLARGMIAWTRTGKHQTPRFARGTDAALAYLRDPIAALVPPWESRPSAQCLHTSAGLWVPPPVYPPPDAVEETPVTTAPRPAHTKEEVLR